MSYYDKLSMTFNLFKLLNLQSNIRKEDHRVLLH